MRREWEGASAAAGLSHVWGYRALEMPKAKHLMVSKAGERIINAGYHPQGPGVQNI